MKRIVTVKSKASFVGLLRNPLHFFHTVADHDASLAEITLGGQRFYLVNDPDLIRDIFVTRSAQFEKFPQGNPKQKLFGNGLLTSEGAAQKAQRRILLPGFHRDRLQAYAGHMVDLVEEITAGWQSGEAVDMAAFMTDLTLRVIGRSLFSIDDVNVLGELGHHLATMLHMVNRFVMPWGSLLMRLPLPSSRRYLKASARLELIVDAIITHAKNSNSDNLLRVLMDARKPDGTALGREEIRDEIVTMIIAGHETVAVGLTWCLYLLANNPALQDDLADRAESVLAGARPGLEHYAGLEFLQHTFSESLRLYPPIWIMGRRALEPYSFADFTAPSKSVFLVCMANLHRRPEFFPDPESFRPERWLNPTWPSYAFIPFGAGDRRCIGERFAWMEGVFFLASLLTRWTFAPLQAEPVAVPQLTLHPKGQVLLRIASRERKKLSRRLRPGNLAPNPDREGGDARPSAMQSQDLPI